MLKDLKPTIHNFIKNKSGYFKKQDINDLMSSIMHYPTNIPVEKIAKKYNKQHDFALLSSVVFRTLKLKRVAKSH